MDNKFKSALKKAVLQHDLSKEDVVTLLNAAPGDEQQLLFQRADQVRQRYHGNGVHLRGIIEFSSYCKNDCYYCGLRRSNKDIHRYRMTVEQVLDAARQALEMGFRTIVLQSGEDPWYNVGTIAKMIYGIKKMGDVAVTLSIGERSRAEYYLLRFAGADRYLIKHETSDRNLFNKLRPGTDFDRRIQCLEWLNEAGFQVGSGNIIGLPGQTIESLADDILLLKQLDVEMAGIGPFIPHDQTPLAGAPHGDLQLTLKALAVTRLMLPQTHLPATTAAGTLHPRGRHMALNAGANVIMPNVTPLEYRQLYQIYPNKAGSTEQPRQSLENIISIIREVGREVAQDRGDSPKERFQISI
ncbi:[FeFe] hydrogenase H-cluster radical SAM maturase HydE [Desulfofalx alkaliphila]|uniref:[FeFe] hydrogenase H-cluster radical SAM maturase HydE n=1 Tax=Desulfofalx alkaliphila TaxID=105483 RepID=UPI0004E0DACF|nr:[FeFe] hydrogenase H-cluster radical SAM maturase HydE [Desulfofalx alkaliphila]